MSSRNRGRWIIIALGFTVLAGCDSHKEKAVANARTLLAYEIKNFSRPKYAGDLDMPYLLARKKLALEFLTQDPALEEPYMVSADLWLSAVDPPASGMTFVWCEYETHAAGVMLADANAGARRTWKLPIFAWEKQLWHTTAGTSWRDTVLRLRRAWLLPIDGREPSVKEVPRVDGRPPVQVLMPRHVLKVDLEVAVYDEKGNVSNFVPVFVWPGEPHRDSVDTHP